MCSCKFNSPADRGVEDNFKIIMPAKKTVKTKKSSVEKTTAKKGAGKSASASVEKKDAKKAKKTYALLKGMHDILPKSEKYWKTLYHKAEELSEVFYHKRIETPVLEEASLFIRSIGKGTDVVDKEMYIFEDKDKKKIALRPEMTASVVRAYINHGFWNYPQPVKLWYWGSMFRHDKPQAGRYREFRQLGYEIFGEDDPVAEAQLILMSYTFFKDLGLPVEIHINSLGTAEDRERYKAVLVDYYRGKRSYLCEDCKKRINKNPLRLLDCKEEQCRPIKDEAPQIVDWLAEDSKAHFMKVLEYLDELGIPYTLRSSLVRGLDYYNKTVFEIYSTAGEEGAQSALGGGGRYDTLVEDMGGPQTPAIGLSIGLERVVSYYRKCCEAEITSIPKTKPHVFLAQLGDQARRVALKMIDGLHKKGIKTEFNFSKKSLKNQLDIANNLKVPFALIIGQKEVLDKTVIVRDMDTGSQEIVDRDKVVSLLQKKIAKLDEKVKK